MIVQFELLEHDARKTVELLRLLSDPMAAHLARRIESQIGTAQVQEKHRTWTSHVSGCVECTFALEKGSGWVDLLCSTGQQLRSNLIEAKKGENDH